MTYIYHDNSVGDYFYSAQLRKYIIQFMAIFTGIKVKIGKNDFDSDTDLMSVPIKYGTSDRVVSNIIAGFTQNKPIRLPMMAAYMTGIYLDASRAKGTNQVQRNVRLPIGGTFPDDLKNVVKENPKPYQMNMELSIYVSNDYQKMQILEQILVLFDPTLQIQTSDDSQDITKISTVELIDILNEEQYPSGETNRMLIMTMTFKIPVYLSVPINIKSNIVNNIKLRMDAISTQKDVYVEVNDVTNTTDIDENLINIDDLDIPDIT
jgi:hypothetical protein